MPDLIARYKPYEMSEEKWTVVLFIARVFMSGRLMDGCVEEKTEQQRQGICVRLGGKCGEKDYDPGVAERFMKRVRLLCESERVSE